MFVLLLCVEEERMRTRPGGGERETRGRRKTEAGRRTAEDGERERRTMKPALSRKAEAGQQERSFSIRDPEAGSLKRGSEDAK